MTRTAGTTCTLYYDYEGWSPPDAGDFIRSSGGSLYEVLQARPSPTISGRFYLKVVRCVRNADTGTARVLPLHWYRR